MSFFEPFPERPMYSKFHDAMQAHLRRFFVGLLIVAFALSARDLHAQFTWDGGGGTNWKWTTGTNWAGDVAPSKSANTGINFAGATGVSSLADLATNNFNEVWQVGRINFNAGAASFAVSSSRTGNIPGTGGIELSANQGGNLGIRNESSNQQNVFAALTLSANNTFQTTGTGGLVVGGATIALGTFGLTTAAAASTTIHLQSSISGTGSLTIGGSGTTELRGTNSYSGGTTLGASSILNINSNTALGTGTFTINGGTIDNSSAAAITLRNNNALNLAGNFAFTGTQNLNLGTGATTISGATRTVTVNGGTLTFGGVIDDGASTFGLTKAGAGALTLAGANTFGGGPTGVTLNAGTLNINNAAALGTGTFTIAGGTINNTSGAALNTTNAQTWSGDFAFTGTNNLSQSTGAVTLNANRIVTVDAGNLSVGGAIGGAFRLTKEGAGALTLSGANTNSGVTLNAGTLNINSATALGAGASAFIIAGGTIDNTSGAALTNTNNNAQTWNGNFAFTGTNNLNLGTGAVTLGATRTLTVNGGTLTVGGIIDDGASTFGLVKNGAGTLTLSGANTFGSGATGVTLNAGTLNINNATALGAGTFTIAGGEFGTTATSITASNAITLSANAIANIATGNTLTLSGALSNAAFSLTKNGNGTLVLSGNNLHDGGTIVNAGTLTLSGSNTGATGGVTLNSGATLNVNNANGLGAGTFVINGGTLNNSSGGAITNSGNNAQTWAGNFTYTGSNTLNLGTGAVSLTATPTVNVAASTLTVGGVISGAQGITKDGAGTLTLTGASTYTGTTTVNRGTLNLDFTGPQTTNILNNAANSSALTLRGGTLQLTGGAGETNSQRFNGTNVSLGASTVTLTLNGATSLTAQLNAIARTAGATLNFSVVPNTTTLLANTTSTNTNNILGPWATVGTGTSLQYATVDGSNRIVSYGAATNAGGNLGSVTNAATNYTYGNTAVTLAGNQTGNTLSKTGTAQTWATAGFTLTLNGLLNAGSGTLTISGTGALPAGSTHELVIFGNTQTTAISANITGGSAAVTYTGVGGGALTLSGTNTFGGGLTLNSGTLNFNSTTAAGSGTLTINGGTLNNSSGADITNTNNNAQTWNGDFTFTGSRNLTLGTGAVTLNGNRILTVTANTLTVGGLAGSGSLSKAGAGTLTINGTSSNTGTTTVSAGNLTVGTSGTLGTTSNLVVNGGTLNLNNTADQTVASLSGTGGTIALASGVDLNVNSAASTSFAGTISSAGSFTKSGAGTLTLSNTGSSYSGGTTLSGGTLSISTLANSGANSNVGTGNFTFSGGALQYTGTTVASNRNLSLGTGGGTVIADGTGPLTLSGTVTGTVAGAKTFTLSGNNSGNNTLSGAITDGTGTTALAKTGTGNWVIASASNTYTGGTTISAGNLTVNSGATLGGATGNLTVNGGTLAFNNAAQTVANFSGSGGTLQLGSGHALTVNQAVDNSFSGAISGPGSLTKSGSANLTLSGTSTFSGNIVVSQGTLIAQGNGSLGAADTGSVTVRGGSTLRLNGYSSNHGILTLGNGTSTGSLEAAAGADSTYTGTIVLGNSTTVTSNVSGSNFLALGATPPSLPRTGTDLTPQNSTTLDLGANNLSLRGTGTIFLNSMITGTGNVSMNMTNSTDGVGLSSRMNTFSGTFSVEKGTLTIASNARNSAPYDPATPGFYILTGGLTIGNGAGGTAGGDTMGSYVYDSFVRMNSGATRVEQLYFNIPVTLNNDGRWELYNNQTIGALTFNGGRIDLGTSPTAGSLFLNDNVNVNATAGNTAYITGGDTGNGLSLTRYQSGFIETPNATRTFTVADSSGVTDDLRIDARIFNGGIIKEGAGTMTVTSDNSSGYELTTVINNGIYNIQHGSALGLGGTVASSTTVNAGGQLQLQGDITVASEILTLNGVGFGSGGTLYNKLGNNTWSGSVTSNNGTINSDITGASNHLTINGTLTTNTNTTVFGSGNTTLSGAITGSGNLTKNGTGELIIAGNDGLGANTFSGNVSVTAGILHIQKNTALGDAVGNRTTIDSGASLYLSNNINTTAGEQLYISGTGVTAGTGQGALHNFSGTNTFGGTVNLSASSTITAANSTSMTIRGPITGNSTTNLTVGSAGFEGTVIMPPSSGSITGTVNNVNIAKGTFQVGGAGTTTFNTGEFSSATGTTLIVGSGGTINARFDDGAITNFNGGVGSGSAGTFALTSTGTTSGIAFNSTWSATNLTLKVGGLNPADTFTLTLGTGVGITVGTLHITGNTILDFTGSSSTFLSSANLIIDAGVTVTVKDWISGTTVWYVTNQSGGITGPGGSSPISIGPTQYGTGVLPQITFTNYNGFTTTWVTPGSGGGWMDREIRPTPEPATYGAIFLGSCFALLGFRRYRSRKQAAAQA